MPCYNDPSNYCSEEEREKKETIEKTKAILCALTKYIQGTGLLEPAEKYVKEREGLSLINWMIHHQSEDLSKNIRKHKVEIEQ